MHEWIWIWKGLGLLMVKPAMPYLESDRGGSRPFSRCRSALSGFWRVQLIVARRGMDG